jgi:glucose-1-phosphatase
MIKLIIFDIAGVVLNYPKDTFIETLAKKANKSVEETGEKFYEVIYRGETGELSECKAIEIFLRENRIICDAKQLQQERHQNVSLNRETIKLIKNLKMQYKIAFATNNSKDEFETNNELFHIKSFFDYGLSSHMVKARKTEPIIFTKILEHFNVKPKETVFLDDGEEYVKTAEKLGIHAIHFTNLEQAKEELSKLDIKTD